MILAKIDPADIRMAIVLSIGLAVGFWLLFLPGIIAHRRGHPNATAIKVCGILGGLCTGGLLWLIALIWAYTSPSRVVVADAAPGPRARPLITEDLKPCPFCAETIKAAAIVCRHCGRDLNAPPAARVEHDPDFERLIDEEIAVSDQPRRWRIRGIRAGKPVSGTVTATTAEAARTTAARHFETITSVEQA